MENRNGATPVIPLPNPGEGGAVYPGDTAQTPADPGQIPVIPLPNPGEGGPVYTGPDYPVPQPTAPQPPVMPVYPPYAPPGANTIIIQPLPGFTVPSRYAAVRFLNATHGYPAFRIFLDNTRVSTLLDAGTATNYIRIPAGRHTVTVEGQDGYVYIESSFFFPSASVSTIALLNRTGGLTLAQISDNRRVY